MKVSLNWVRELSGVTTKTPELLELIGARLGAVDEVIDFGARYQGIVVAKVIECEKHPNADKLHVCKIDDKGVTPKVKRDAKGLVQVVCGAPNVSEGMLVAWIPPGATVPSTADKDPFVLEAKELRGMVSSGMLASAAELGFGDDHSGLLELDGSAKVGASFAKTYDLDDTIIDIENKMFTHRPDCFGQLGVAREIAGITHKQFKSPGWYKADAKPSAGRASAKIVIKNEVPKLVPRFCALVVEGVEVKPSPIWLQASLTKLGLKPINNIVDITNYMMLLTAQPMHAYDYDKLSTGTLGIRLSKDGETLKLLNGKQIKLKKGTLVIADGKRPIGLGGVMGGSDTEVDAGTKTIVLEVASFDMEQTRKNAFEYGLFTDAATRFTKGQSPLQNGAVITRAAELIEQLSGGKSGSLQDSKNTAGAKQRVIVSPSFISSRLGTTLTETDMARLLANVEFEVTQKKDSLNIDPPFWRTDIGIPEDVVEEVGRLHGYEHLPIELPVKSISPAAKNKDFQLKNRLRKLLSEAGANEVLTYSFVASKLLDIAGQNKAEAYKLANALSPELEYYRLSLTPSLLEKIHPNIKAGFDEFALFEIGKAHGKSEVDESKLPKEMGRLAAVFAAKRSGKDAPFFLASRYVRELASQFGYSAEFKPLGEVDLKGHKLADQMLAPYEPSRSAWVLLDGKLAGVVGEYRQALTQSLKLPAYCSGFELFLSVFDAADAPAYAALPRYPSIDQDICLRAFSDASYQQLTDFLNSELAKAASQHGYSWRLEPVDIFQKDGDRSHKQTTWRISLNHPERTLVTSEVNNLLDEIAAQAKKQLKAERI